MEYPTSEQIEKIIEEIKETFEKQLKNKEEFNRQRYNTNIQIIDIILEYIKENPNQRFIQALWNLDIVNNTDRYNEEPQVTLNRINNKINIMKQMRTQKDTTIGNNK